MPTNESLAGQEHHHQQPLSIGDETYKRMVREIGEYAMFMLNNSNPIMPWNKGAGRILGDSEQEYIRQAVWIRSG